MMFGNSGISVLMAAPLDCGVCHPYSHDRRIFRRFSTRFNAGLFKGWLKGGEASPFFADDRKTRLAGETDR